MACASPELLSMAGRHFQVLLALGIYPGSSQGPGNTSPLRLRLREPWRLRASGMEARPSRPCTNLAHPPQARSVLSTYAWPSHTGLHGPR